VPWFTMFFAKVESRLNCRDIYSETIGCVKVKICALPFSKNGSFDDEITVGYSAYDLCDFFSQFEFFRVN